MFCPLITVFQTLMIFTLYWSITFISLYLEFSISSGEALEMGTECILFICFLLSLL